MWLLLNGGESVHVDEGSKMNKKSHSL